MIQRYLKKGTVRFNSQPTREIQLLKEPIKEKPVNHLAALMEAIEKKKQEDKLQQKQLLNESNDQSPDSPAMRKAENFDQEAQK